jgi:hypothetical protein
MATIPPILRQNGSSMAQSRIIDALLADFLDLAKVIKGMENENGC